MVVDYIRKKENILPIVLGIVFSWAYYKLPLDRFGILLLGFMALIPIFHDIRVGVIIAIIVLPFVDFVIGLIYIAFIIGVYLYNVFFKGVNPLKKEAIDFPIILFAILILISAITSVDFQGSLRDLIFHFIALGFVFVLVNTIDTKRDFNIFITFLVIAATLVAILGLFQYTDAIRIEGSWTDFINNPSTNIRIYSVLDNPNILAEYLVMTIPISIALFWYSKRIHKKLLFFITTSILLLSLVLTLSRGGWLGLSFGMIVFALLVEKKLLFIIPIFAIMVYSLPERILNRLMSIGNYLEDSSSSYRIKIWKIALEVIKDNWLVGVGLGYIPFKMVYESYASNMPTYHIHNTFLQIVGEMGVMGLMVFTFFMFILFKYSIKRLIKGEDRYIQVMAGGLLSGLAALLVHGIVESILFMPKIIITFWTLVGLILALMRISKEEEQVG
ncbi:MAG: polymerase [Tissierellia bacterium]|nr:polymerase [Tissierellia bacterium]